VLHTRRPIGLLAIWPVACGAPGRTPLLEQGKGLVVAPEQITVELIAVRVVACEERQLCAQVANGLSQHLIRIIQSASLLPTVRTSWADYAARCIPQKRCFAILLGWLGTRSCRPSFAALLGGP
jgi:hypothetical protein